MYSNLIINLREKENSPEIYQLKSNQMNIHGNNIGEQYGDESSKVNQKNKKLKFIVCRGAMCHAFCFILLLLHHLSADVYLFVDFDALN